MKPSQVKKGLAYRNRRTGRIAKVLLVFADRTRLTYIYRVSGPFSKTRRLARSEVPMRNFCKQFEPYREYRREQ